MRSRKSRAAQGWGALLVLLSACGTPMTATRLTPPVRVHEHGLGIHVAEVHVSANVRDNDFSESSRLLVVLDLIADTDSVLDLSGAKLSLGGAGDPEVTRVASTTGIGQPPLMLSDGEFVPALRLPQKTHVRAWVAFGGFGARATREIPERLVLELPSGQRLLLSQPGDAPVWQGKPSSTSYGTAFWVQFSADETATNITLEDISVAAGPLVLGARHGFGVRTPETAPHPGDSPICCNIALATDVTWPVWHGGRFMLGPFLGFESSLLLGHHEVNRRNWYGPSLGVELALAGRPPLHGPFPISYQASLLGVVRLRAALVHWFGPDRSLPSFGFMLSLGTALGN